MSNKPLALTSLEKDDNINSTNNINTASDGNNTNNVNALSSTVNVAGSEVIFVDPKTNIKLTNDLNMPELKDIVYSDDDKDVGAEADINNLDTHIPIEAMQEELLQFKLQQVWTLMDLPNGKRAIGFEDPDLPDRVYKRGKIDKTLFIRRVKSDILLVQVYVDDIIFGSTKKSLCIEFEKMMHKKFQMSSMGELTFFLGLQVKQKEDGIFISQDKYVTEILKKFGFTDVKTASTPMETHKPLLKDADGEDVDEHLYRSMIGSLMYLTSSRPDIMFAVCACARYQVNPKVSHLHAVKRIFRYLKGQPKLGLWYPKDSPFDLVAYTDSDYAGASLDRKSTTGGCQFLGYRLISWQCKKHTVVPNFTTKAEYIAASNCCGQSTIYIVKNPVFHSKTKHIEIRHHFIRDSNEKKLIQMIKIHTDHNVADLLTKAFDVSRFQYLIAINAARYNLLLLLKVNAARHHLLLLMKVTVVRHNLLLPIQVNAVEGDFINTLIQGFIQSLTQFQSLIRVLSKPEESDGFEQIVDFLNANPINYALTVNPTIYTSCIKQFWATAKAKTVNEEVQIQALVDGKKVIVTKASVRRDLQLADKNGTECLPNATIFVELEIIGYEKLTQKLTFYKAFFAPQWKFLIHTILQCLSAKTTAWNEFSITIASAVICLATNQKFNFSKYIFDNMVKNLEGRVKLLMYPRFVQVFLDKQVEGMSKHKEIYVTPSHTKKVFANIKRQGKDFFSRDAPFFPTMIVQAQEQVGEAYHKEFLTWRKQRPLKIGRSAQVVSSEDEVDETQERYDDAQMFEEESQEVGKEKEEDASKQGRKITDIDVDAEVKLIDETQGRNDDNLMFDTGVLDE
ncbi:putative ribonuclease H-like domain-containing protein [Tanacetum coccineum]